MASSRVVFTCIAGVTPTYNSTLIPSTYKNQFRFLTGEESLLLSVYRYGGRFILDTILANNKISNPLKNGADYFFTLLM